jgi:hypothetical protein
MRPTLQLAPLTQTSFKYLSPPAPMKANPRTVIWGLPSRMHCLSAAMSGRSCSATETFFKGDLLLGEVAPNRAMADVDMARGKLAPYAVKQQIAPRGSSLPDRQRLTALLFSAIARIIVLFGRLCLNAWKHNRHLLPAEVLFQDCDRSGCLRLLNVVEPAAH